MTWGRFVVVPLALVVAACGGDGQGDHAAPPDPAGVGGSSRSRHVDAGGPAEDDTTFGGVTSGGAGGFLGEGETEPPAELGGASNEEVLVVEVPAGEGSTLQVSPQVFLDTTPEFYVFDRAGVVGQRHFALDSSSLALMSFEADGTAASDVVLDLPVAAAARGDDLVVLSLDDQDELVAVTYHGELQPVAENAKLAAHSSGAYALAGSASQSVAVWSEDEQLHGQLFDAQGLTGEGFDFGPRSCGAHDCAANVVYSSDRFAVLWSRVNATGESMLSWGTIDGEGAALAARNVLSSVTALHLEDTAPLPDGRLAVLLTLGVPAQNPLLLFLDTFGVLERTLHVYAGASAAWTLVSDGSSLLMAARSQHSQGVIRQLDLSGEPLSDWLVVDDSGISTAFEPRVALFSAGNSYGAVVRMTDGSSATLDIDPESFPKP